MERWARGWFLCVAVGVAGTAQAQPAPAPEAKPDAPASTAPQAPSPAPQGKPEAPAAAAPEAPSPAPETPTGGAPAAGADPAPAAELEAAPAAGTDPAPAAESTGDADSQQEEPIELRERLQGLDQTGTPSLPSPEGELPEASAPDGEDRPLPDYDGREGEATDAGDVLIWFPRVLFYPVHLVLKYVVEWPVVSLVTVAEKNRVAERVSDVFSWDDGNAFVLPRFLIDFGMRPHVGATVLWNNLADGSTDLNLSASAWADVLLVEGGTSTRIFKNDSGVFSWGVHYERRPDNQFFGINDPYPYCDNVTQANEDNGCRYWAGLLDANAGLVGELGGLSRLTVGFSYRWAEFNETWSDSPPLTAAEADALAGFRNGYHLLNLGTLLELDTRPTDVDFESGTGLRAELIGKLNLDPDNTQTRFATLGTEVSAMVDVGARRVLALRYYLAGVANMGEEVGGVRTPVPFRELIRLGGADLMRGFLPGRLTGDTAMVTTFEYRNPIMQLLDAILFFSMGNVQPDLQSYHWKKTYMNYGVAIRTSGDRRAAFELMMAWGSSRIDRPNFTPFDTFRFNVGVNGGF